MNQRCLFSFLVLLFSFNPLAICQSEHSDSVVAFQDIPLPKISLSQWFGNNFNPGIHLQLPTKKIPYNYVNLNMKLGNAAVQFGFINGATFDYETVQLNLDVVCVNREAEHHRDYLTMTFGGSGKYIKNSKDYLQTTFFVFGISRYYVNHRTSWALQVGQYNQESKYYKLNKWEKEISTGPLLKLGMSYSLFKYRPKPSFIETERLITKIANPYLSLGIGADRIVLFPAVGIKFFNVNLQLAYGRIFWHNKFTGSLEYLLPKGNSKSRNRILRYGVQVSYQAELGGGVLPELYSLQFGRTHFYMDKHRSRFFRFGLGVLHQTGPSAKPYQPIPVISLGYAFHAFTFNKNDFKLR